MPPCRARRIHEFVAHAGCATACAAFGRRSCSVLATGGDDRRVNVWAIGNPAPLLTLQVRDVMGCAARRGGEAAARLAARASKGGDLRLERAEQSALPRR